MLFQLTTTHSLFQLTMTYNSQLSDKDLTHKLTVFVALSSASTASSLQHLNVYGKESQVS